MKAVIVDVRQASRDEKLRIIKELTKYDIIARVTAIFLHKDYWLVRWSQLEGGYVLYWSSTLLIPDYANAPIVTVGDL